MEIRICGGYYVCCDGKCDNCIETKSGIASIYELEKRDEKPLKNWTLGYIKEECEKNMGICSTCPVHSFCNNSIRIPATWDLT